MRRRGLLIGLALVGVTRAASAQFRGLAKGEVLRGRFSQERQLTGFSRPMTSSGSFVLAPGLGLIWRAEQPFSIVTLITASGLMQEVNGTETTRLTAAKLPFLAQLYDLLSGALSGDWEVLGTKFRVTRHGDANQWELTLLPLAGADAVALPFRSIALRGGRYLNQVEIVRADGDFDLLAFSGQTISGGGLSEDEAALLRKAGK